MAPTMSSAQLQDWTAVAQNTIAESATLDITGNYHTQLAIQAALDTTTAHTGTGFIVQGSHNASGDEDWFDLFEVEGLVGTAAGDQIEDNPLAAASTTIALTGHALTALGIWLFIKDGSVLADSELVFESAQATNSITILDGTTNAHAVNTWIYNVAFSRDDLGVMMGSASRIRVLVDNTRDADGSTLNYKVMYTITTGV